MTQEKSITGKDLDAALELSNYYHGLALFRTRKTRQEKRFLKLYRKRRIEQRENNALEMIDALEKAALVVL